MHIIDWVRKCKLIKTALAQPFFTMITQRKGCCCPLFGRVQRSFRWKIRWHPPLMLLQFFMGILWQIKRFIPGQLKLFISKMGNNQRGKSLQSFQSFGWLARNNLGNFPRTKPVTFPGNQTRIEVRANENSRKRLNFINDVVNASMDFSERRKARIVETAGKWKSPNYTSARAMLSPNLYVQLNINWESTTVCPKFFERGVIIFERGVTLFQCISICFNS